MLLVIFGVANQHGFEACCTLQGSPYWEIAAGYVGALKAEIPFTNLYSQAVSLTLDEALLTLRPRSKAWPTAGAAGPPGEASSGSPGVPL